MKKLKVFSLMMMAASFALFTGCDGSDADNAGISGVYKLSAAGGRAIVEQEEENGFYFRIEDNGKITIYRKGGKVLFKTGEVAAKRNNDTLETDFSSIRNFLNSEIADEMDIEDALDAFEEYDKLKAIMAANPSDKDTLFGLITATQLNLKPFAEIAAGCDKYLAMQKDSTSRASENSSYIEKIREFLKTPAADEMDLEDLLEAFEAIDQFNQMMQNIPGMLSSNFVSDSRAGESMERGLDAGVKIVDSRIDWELWEVETHIKLELMEYYVVYMIIQSITDGSSDTSANNALNADCSSLFTSVSGTKSELSGLSGLSGIMNELKDEKILKIADGILTGNKYNFVKIADDIDDAI